MKTFISLYEGGGGGVVISCLWVATDSFFKMKKGRKKSFVCYWEVTFI